jgi:hypothetical protein
VRRLGILIVLRKGGATCGKQKQMSRNLKRMATATDYREEGARIRALTETIGNDRDLYVLREAAELCDLLADRAAFAVSS